MVERALSGRKPKPDFVEEAKELIEEADRRNIVLRIMGGVAIRIHCPKFKNLHEALGRTLTDLDFASYKKFATKLPKLFTEMGYTRKFLRPSYGLELRQIYIDEVNRRLVDVFLDKLMMCHTIDFRGRLEKDYPTIPLADILLEKLQIVKFTDKDLKDVAVLIREHEVGESDEEMINAKYIAKVLSDDWGFYYTSMLNLKKIKELVPTLEALKKEDIEDICRKVDKIIEYIEKEPKSMKWKLRAKIGPKKKWYREVEAPRA